MARAKKKEPAWSYQVGERGRNRVNLFDRGERGLYLEFRESLREGKPGRRVRVSLGHIDREEGKRKADELALEFRKHDATKAAPLSLGKLFDIYSKEVTPTKAPSSRPHDKRRVDMFVSFFGASRKPDTLSIRDWQRFIAERKAGRASPSKSKRKGPVGDEIIRGDLAFLSAVLNFAAIAGDGKGGTLIDRNPLRGLPYPKNDSPMRPTLTSDQYEAMRTAATKIGAFAETFVVLAHETGHRGASIRKLRWSDIDLVGKRIHWLGGNDKMGNDHWTPLTDDAIDALAAYRSSTLAIGDRFLFPKAGDPSMPMNQNAVAHLWVRLAKAADLPKGERFGWHSLRRKFASELRNTNLRDLCDLGGWKKPETVLTCYVRPNEDAQREALTGRGLTRKAAIS